jgi:hypothetical protein
MRMLKVAAIALALGVCLDLALQGVAPVGGNVDKSRCGGFRPETHALCWRTAP